MMAVVCVLLCHFNPLLALAILNIKLVACTQASRYKAQFFKVSFPKLEIT